MSGDRTEGGLGKHKKREFQDRVFIATVAPVGEAEGGQKGEPGEDSLRARVGT